MSNPKTIKVLKLDLYQPVAHYREPGIKENNYVPTLMLPPRTTIAGALSYLIDRRMYSNYKIGVIGRYQSKEIHFARGEKFEYGKTYRASFKKLIKGKKEIDLVFVNQHYNYIKKCKPENSIMNFEVLNNVNLTIFFRIEDEEEYNYAKEVLKEPGKYFALGRKEDFAIPKKRGVLVEEVEIEEDVFVESKETAIKNNIKLKNTYVKIDLRNENSNIINQGVLYSLPETYHDFQDSKADRATKYAHYIYLKDKGYYPADRKINIFCQGDEKIVFTWL